MCKLIEWSVVFRQTCTPEFHNFGKDIIYQLLGWTHLLSGLE